MSLLTRASRRYLTRHPWQLGLAILGVALGVAVVVAIQLANASARAAFDLSTEAVAGRATHQLSGGPEGVPDELYATLRREVPEVPAAPVVEAWASTPTAPGRSLRLLGLDPFAEAPFRPYLRGIGRGDTGLDLGTFLTRPGAVLMAEETAAELGIGVGDSLDLSFSGRSVDAFLAGVLRADEESGRRALAELLVADVATAQELTGRLGVLSRIDLILPAPASGSAALDRLEGADPAVGEENGPVGPSAGREELLAEIEALLPPGVEVLRSESRTRTVEEMTEAFRLNLTALALLALVCGALLIYNTITFSVVQRRRLIGSLRALGVLRGEIFRLILVEAAAIGALGTALGLGLGLLLSRSLVRLVARTINDLYFTVNVTGVSVTGWSLALGAALGMGVTLLAALGPAREATSAPPRTTLSRSELEESWRRTAPRAALAGLALCLAGTALMLAPPNRVPGAGLLTAFAGLFGVLLGCALLAPGATVLLARAARPLLGRAMGLVGQGVLGRMAAGGVIASLSRTGVAIATLMMAVSMAVGVGVMITSFRSTLVTWLETTLAADVYVSAPGPARGPGLEVGPIPETLAAEMARLPGIDRVNTLIAFPIEGDDGVTQLRALDLDDRGRRAFDFRAAEPEDELWKTFADGEAVILSEPYAYRRGLSVGDSLTLATGSGPRTYRVGGVFYDYGGDQGAVVMSRRAFEAAWDVEGFTALAVFAQPGISADSLVDDLRRVAAGADRELQITATRSLKEVSLAIFDRTFLITQVLRLVAGAVAFIGVLAALMALQLERERELGVLRANGLTPRQVWGLITAQTGLMGAIAGLLSIPVGLVMAAIMIYVINRRSFGWSLDLEIPPSLPFEAFGLALAAALLAGLYPAWKMSRTSPTRALREE